MYFILFMTICVIILILFDYFFFLRNRNRIYSFSYIGSRKNQEDAMSIYKKSKDEIMIALADGMGGMSRGDEASSKTVDFMVNGFLEQERLKPGPLLLRLANEVNSLIYGYNKASIRKSHIGTTLLTVIINERKLNWVSVGDSRLYLFRKKRLTKLNREHTYNEMLLDKFCNNEISEERYRKDSNKGNQLTSYIGDETLREIDRNVKEFQLLSGDRLLLCTDGVYNTLTDLEIREILSSRNGMKQKDEFLDTIKEKNLKNQDNASLVLVEIN